MNDLHARCGRDYPVSSLCMLLGVSTQAYYKQDGGTAARKAARESFALEYIRRIRKLDPGIGGPKLWYMYCQEFPPGERVGRDWFGDILDRYHLKVRKRMRKPRTTDSRHGLPLYPDLAREFIPTAVNQLWVSDITYIPVWLGEKEYAFCYLSMVMDAYSREITGWAVESTLETRGPAAALDMASARLEHDGSGKASRLIHHSDRGIQYASKMYTDMLRSLNIDISMTQSGDPKENAQAERVNSTVKNELLAGFRFTSLEEVRQALELAIDFYNTQRPHMSLDMMTPEQASHCNGEIHKLWDSRREKAIKNGRA